MTKVFTKKLRKELYHGESEFVIEEGYDIIGSEAFRDCDTLIKIYIPRSVKEIRKNAFECCIHMETVEFAETSALKRIDDCAFYRCGSLKGIKFPHGLETIGNSAFELCTSLTSIDIPVGVLKLGRFAFSDCDSLTNVDLSNNELITAMEDGVFGWCNKMERIWFPVKDVSACTGLNGITISPSAFFPKMRLVAVPESEYREWVASRDRFNNIPMPKSYTNKKA
jgi:hypothetical protein